MMDGLPDANKPSKPPLRKEGAVYITVSEPEHDDAEHEANELSPKISVQERREIWEKKSKDDSNVRPPKIEVRPNTLGVDTIRNGSPGQVAEIIKKLERNNQGYFGQRNYWDIPSIRRSKSDVIYTSEADNSRRNYRDEGWELLSDDEFPDENEAKDVLTTLKPLDKDRRSTLLQGRPLYQSLEGKNLFGGHGVDHSGSIESSHTGSSSLSGSEHRSDNSFFQTDSKSANLRLKHSGLWSSTPYVQSSGILNQMTTESRKLQEALYEVITTEASYLKSLDVVVKHFMGTLENKHILTKYEISQLFSNLHLIRDASERFLAAVDAKQEGSILVQDFFGELKNFTVDVYEKLYIKYCSNLSHQTRILKELTARKPAFVASVRMLESDPKCSSMTLPSFLLLPMQRITQLPLLLKAIEKRASNNAPLIRFRAQKAHTLLSHLAKKCDKEASRMEDLEAHQAQLIEIQRQLIILPDLKVNIVSPNRRLLCQGDMTELIGKKTMISGHKSESRPIHIKLFNDLILFTRRTAHGEFIVEEHASILQGNMFISVEDVQSKVPFRISNSNLHRKPIVLTFSETQLGKYRDPPLVLVIGSQETREVWIKLLMKLSCAISPEDYEAISINDTIDEENTDESTSSDAIPSSKD